MTTPPSLSLKPLVVFMGIVWFVFFLQAVKALDNARRGMKSAAQEAAELESRRSQVSYCE